jgi:hypothetical protein
MSPDSQENQVKSKILELLTLTLVALCGVAGAAPVLVGTSTHPTGVNGLVVDGTTYNLTFSSGSYNATYLSAPTFEGNLAGASDAAAALKEFLNLSGVNGLLGSDCSTTSFGCRLIIPSGTLLIPPIPEFMYGYLIDFQQGFSAWGPPSQFSGGSPADPLGCNHQGGPSCQEFVVFTAADSTPVPEPFTLGLVGLGLAGVVFTRRCRI